MAPATRKNDPDAPPGGERQAELEAQLTQLRAGITALQANNQAQRQPPLESKARVPSGLPKFKAKRDDDVRQWLFQVETLCRINGHNATDDNYTLPWIAGTAMEEPASGWFLFWASKTPTDMQTWRRFTGDALAHFEASNYQAVLRQKLRELRRWHRRVPLEVLVIDLPR
ncbi:hypothetical protein F443_23138 [Phytophthora nicotianae P1569]|uniref:Ty3 transposon capsid-like protein domain-containing protein n=1 Tax=Phytophthora nicotianae P1569 TaxID=1317065 RepID=V9DS79_PHYNI|nr:hypothetical protein F443_23138 [Phytophthora nicotianae P1569]